MKEQDVEGRIEDQDSLWNLVLIGFMASGKTTVGRMLARQMERDFVDLDQMIEAAQGMGVSEIFDRYGEEHFRELEEHMVEEVSDREGLVLAVGGGAVLRRKNVQMLKNGGILYLLKVDTGEVLKRVAEDETRPLLEGKGRARRVETLLRDRLTVYEAVADYEVETVGRSPGDVADEVRKDFLLRTRTVD